MNPTFLLPSVLFIFYFSISTLFGQEASYHQIIIETEQFSNQEIEHLKEHLISEHSFEIMASCANEGLILVGFPTTLPIRVPHAEQIITSAIAQLWEQESSVSRGKSRESILNCGQ